MKKHKIKIDGFFTLILLCLIDVLSDKIDLNAMSNWQAFWFMVIFGISFFDNGFHMFTIEKE